MSKLLGYDKVAVVSQGYREYHFAIYEDGFDYKIGDKVMVTGDSSLKTISDIISYEEACRRYNGSITSEVIGKVDTSAYENRVTKRRQAEEIRKAMDKKIKEMQEVDKYEMYAKQNSELAEMLSEYKSLISK